ncbi:hypothetical protein FS749_015668 [Ceratobasidium sp. UAMH 11750]|nr:hypothetical protein FS749_015668 [Ceratobasidium sp. UAMH 11750]
MSGPAEQVQDSNLETFGEFTGMDDQHQPTQCQKPMTGGKCYKPVEAANLPDGTLYPYTSKSNNTSYMLCIWCKSHMDQKGSTVTRARTQPKVSSPSGSGLGVSSDVKLSSGYTLYNVNHAQIRSGTNAAQRGTGASLQAQYTPDASSSVHLTSPSKRFQGSPTVGIPMLPPSPGVSRSLGFGKPGPKSLLPSVECQRQGQKTSHVAFLQEIQTKGIPNVNAFSTGPQLKNLVLSHATKDWQAATFNHPLHDDMCTLRDKSGVDLADSFPDIPALRNQCINRGAKGQEHFAFNKTVKVVLMLTPVAYEMVEKHIDECRSKEPDDIAVTMAAPVPNQGYNPPESTASHPKANVGNGGRQVTVSNGTHSTGDGPALSTTPKRPTLKRAFVTSPTSTIRSPPFKRLASQTTPATLTTPQDQASLGPSTDSRLQAALQLHGQQRKPCVDASRSAAIHFFPIFPPSLEALMDEKQPLDFNDPTQASQGHILYNPAFKDHRLGAGTFKRCHKGKLVIHPIPITGLGSPNLEIVAIKRPFVLPAGKTTPTRLPAGDEIQFVVQEATVWRWATALLSLVYGFIQAHPRSPEQDPPPTPLIRFVQIGMAKCVIIGSASHIAPEGAFLVEENIPAEAGFVRYLGNNSALPLSFPEESHSFTVAQFCAFCQHVQWVLTKGMVYCADWQGGTSSSHEDVVLLTDPQLMTHPYIFNI